MTKRHQILLLGLSLSLYACPDNTTGGDTGGTTGGSIGIAGETISGTEAGEPMGAMMTGDPCFDDSECPDGTYCLFGEDFNNSCVEGCAEDSCDGGRVCDLETRECVFPPCAGDPDCPEGTYCNDDVCETGCRLDEACPGDGFDDDGRAILCDPLTRECISHSPCCVSADGEESCVEATSDQCSALDGQLMQSVLLCDDDPCGQTCEVDVDCRTLDVGGATYYCDPADSRCREGCRQGECDGDLICDISSRICTSQNCVTSDDCAEGQFCNPVDLFCESGCGSDDDCEGGFTCSNNLCVERCDPDNDTCGDNQYCDGTTQICRDQCTSHTDCNESEACNPLSSRCEVGQCRDDEAIGDLSGEPNSTFEQASRLTLVPVASNPDYSSARVEGRIICGTDPDLYRISLAQGERMSINLSHEGGGDLDIRIFPANDTLSPIAEVSTLSIPETLEYPGEAEVRDAQDYYIEIAGQLGEDTRLGYDLSIQTAPLGNACFFDDRESEAGDNDKDTATPLIPNGETRYDDGTICVGDQDWFSIPLTVNDGLNLEIRTTIAAQPIRLDIFSASALNAIGGNPTPNYSASLETSSEEDASGDRVYSINVPFNSAGFEDGTWYLKISGGDSDSYANYRLLVSHDASAIVCTADAYEPNNGVNQGTDIITELTLATDDGGLLAQGQDNRVQNVSLCSGDMDYYCFDLADGDKIEAWVISDSTIGSLTVSFVDDEGGSVGIEGRHTTTGEDFDKASFIGALAGQYCAVVDGLNNAQGSYEINIRRTVIMGGACGIDEADGRNDIADNATALTDVSDEQGLRFERRNGLICGAATDRADWYSFPVATDESSICAMLEGFEHDDIVGGLDIELYESPRDDTDVCTNDSNCDNGACIVGHCQFPSRDSTYIFDFEMTELPRANVSAGQHYLRVTADGTATSMPYDLSVTVTPGRDVCQPDWQEAGDPNDNSRLNGYDPSRATVLGSGSAGICDSWICRNPNGQDDEDWYQITVPAQQDRTIIINYGSQTDGHLELFYFGETETSMGFDSVMASTTPSYNYQCINVSGGESAMDVEFGVLSGLGFQDDGDQRIDYNLKVVPTDLSVNPDGACPLLGADDFSSCTMEEIFSFEDMGIVVSFVERCWPTVYLP